MFFQFSKYLLLNFMKDWLCVKEVGMLDSALCNKKYRLTFETWLTANNTPVFQNDQIHANEVYMLIWLITRQVNVDKLSLKAKLNAKRITNINHHVFLGLLHLKIACGFGHKSF